VLILLAVLFITVWFCNLDYRKLIRPDEGRYAEVPREMAVTGDWITPRLNGIKYFEKPPLQYWATAAAYRTFGEHEWTARLWPAITGFLGILLVFFAGRSLFGATAGLYASLILASSTGYVASAHFNSLDMGLAFFLTATLLAYLLAQRPDATPRTNRLWTLAAWAAAALAVLSKGLIGVVVPAAVLAIYVVLQRDFARLRGLHWGMGIIVFLAIAAPWFVLVQLANPEFARFFFVHEHFERFLTTVHRRVEPWWFFFPILAIGILPWLTLLPQALARAWRVQGQRTAFQPGRFLLIGAAFIFMFFSASSSKLPGYILPMFPLLALLIGSRLAAMRPRELFWHLIPILLCGVLIAMLSPHAVTLARKEELVPLYEAYVPWIAAGGVCFLIGASIALYCCRRDKVTAALSAMAIGGLLSAQLITTGHNALAPNYSGYYLAQAMKPHLEASTPVYSVQTYEQSLPFYIKRTVTLVAFQDEMAYGLKHEPRLWLPDLPSFERAWRNARSALAILGPDTYAELEKSGLPMQFIGRDLHRIVVRKPDD
jgi:4-amino-4-deoxy-L-arabinose transferase-like glycosyltransferase